jgi:hypothetical protein
MADIENETSDPGRSVSASINGFGALNTHAGWRVFLQAPLSFHVEPDAAKKYGLVWNQPSECTFEGGVTALANFTNNMLKTADAYCQQWIQTLYDKGYRIHCTGRGKQVLKDGTRVGPGVAVFFEMAGAKHAAKPDVLHNEALAIGKNLEFGREGVRVTVEEFEYGIVSGGMMSKAVFEDPTGSASRVVLESLGFGRRYGTISAAEFNVMNVKVSNIYQHFMLPRLRPDDEAFRQECEQLMKELSRRMKISGIQDDGQVWDTIRDEIGMGCPAFARLPEAVQWNIFHRVKVRLGLVEDDV